MHKKMIQRLTVLLFCCILTSVASEGLTQEKKGKPSPPATIHELEKGFRRVELPAGTGLIILLQTPISTAINHTGDLIEAEIARPVYLGSSILFSQNTRLKGTITRLAPPIRGSNAILGVMFNELILENGEHLPIEAHVNTGNSSHVWGGELTPGTKPKRVTHRVMGIGEYNQTVFIGPRAMGKDQTFSPGEPWPIILDKPVSLTLPANSNTDDGQ